MADEPKRIIDLTEVSSVAAGDYLAMDSEDGGTKKIKVSYLTGGSENYMWGAIQGDIEDQTDLATRLNAIEETLPNKADIDGYYDEMAVGSAEQLLSNMFETDKSPYLFRPSGGSLEIGDRKYPTIVGASFPVNQLVNSVNSSGDTHGITRTQVGNVSTKLGLNYSGTCRNTTNFTATVWSNSFIANHVYFSTLGVPLPAGCRINYSDVDQKNSTLLKTTANLGSMGLYINEGVTVDITVYPQVTDLTLMFGSAIADYVYTLESGTAGAGIAWLKANGFFTKDYYPYNAGGIESVKTSAHKTVGFNQFDKSKAVANSRWSGDTKTSYPGNTRSDYIPCFPNTTYYFKNVRGMSIMTPIYWYDINKNYISANSIGSPDPSSGTATSPANAYYMGINFPSSYIDTVCVNLHWDGERDGQYEKYKEHTYPLDSDLELRGIPKLDTNNKLYYDGDVYESDGTVTRRYGIVDLGSLDWTKNATYQSNWRFTASLSGVKRSADATSIPNIVCSKYQANSPQATYLGYSGISINNSSDSIEVCDLSYSDAATFKTAMSGIYLVYELATPTTESADPYTSPQTVSNWGTEEYVDERDVPIPVGHSTKYLPDLKAKLEVAPDSPSVDGDYLMHRENGQNAYTPLIKELPTLPSEDGTYALKCTVASGSASLAWVAEE